MPTQHIYLNDSNYELLKKVDNMSELINQLLNDYFEDFKKTDKQIIDEVKEKIKLKELNEKKKKIEEEEIKKKKETYKKISFDLFREEMGKEMSEEEFSEYEVGYNCNNFTSIWSYIKFLKNQEGREIRCQHDTN